MTSSWQLSVEQIQQFQRDGFLVTKGFYNVERGILPIQRGIRQIIGQVLKRYGFKDACDPFVPEHFDEGCKDLIKANRSYGGEVYEATKQIPAFMRLLEIAQLPGYIRNEWGGLNSTHADKIVEDMPKEMFPDRPWGPRQQSKNSGMGVFEDPS